MKTKELSLDDFLMNLREKGFKFEEDVIGFIYFGKQYTAASDTIIKAAIEITLKTQKKFDGSFYISLLESLKQNNLISKEQAFEYAEKIGLISK
ncbi:DUF6123 family protein [Bacillus sp. FJAT-49736]|uniref:DUF6123 family protein n=1 Tax=Bacillus sp. FJAT-49736 TaxID=2833582 RepID=UPI0020166173|nr:DUF6123 family protein [Bacillus sp. FJAT-49736]